jgi:NAD(P)H dehydrogenase (quinone)
MSVVVTGATGQLGRLTVEALLRRGVPAPDVVATGRDVTGIKDLAERGVVVRRADFADPDSLAAAFAGADKLLLISASIPVDERVANHRRAIDAALAAGVSLVAYTSMLHADTGTTILAATHRATEEYLRERGVPSVLLRNGWYLESSIGQLPQVLQNGTVIGAAGQGKVSAASRADYAEAAAVVLTTEGHAGAVYELGGDEAFTQSELAAAISAAAGKQITYTELSAPNLAQVLTDAGLPGELPDIFADNDLGWSRGELFTSSRDLRRLIGRPTTPLAEAVADALP